MEEVHRIARVRRNFMDAPVVPEVIRTVTVDTFGEEYPEPETV